jgi:hypothetical protein
MDEWSKFLYSSGIFMIWLNLRAFIFFFNSKIYVLSNLLILALFLICCFMKIFQYQTVNIGAVFGLAISNLLPTTSALSSFITKLNDSEFSFNSVERLKIFLN